MWEIYIPGPAELNFFEPIDDLVKVEDEVGTVRDKETVSTVETWEVQVTEFRRSSREKKNDLAPRALRAP